MKKAIDVSLSVIGRVIFIGLSVQIVLGILWAFGALPGFQQFQDSFHYLAVSEKLVWDEYTGILYPLILRLLRGVCSILPFSYTYFLYPLQLLAAFFAVSHLLENIFPGQKATGTRQMKGFKGFWNVWGTLAALTVPVALQCHMAVLPLSFAGSCFLAQLACLWKVRGAEKKDVFKVGLLQGVFFVFGSLLLPEYVLFGAVTGFLFVIFAVRNLRSKKSKTDGVESNAVEKKGAGGNAAEIKDGKEKDFKVKKSVCACVGIYLLALGFSIGGNCLLQTPGSWGKMHRSFESMYLERMAFNHLNDTWFIWPGEMEELWYDPELSDVAHNALDRRDKMGPAFEAKFGIEGSKEKYVELVNAYLYYLKPEAMIQIRWDAFGYLLPPLASEALMQGKGYYNYLAKNYDAFQGSTPVLSTVYYRYYTGWFVPGMLLLGLAVILLFVKSCMEKNVKVFLGNALPYIATMACAVVIPVWYTLQVAGTWDYKNSYPYFILWYVFMVGLCIHTICKEKEGAAE